MVNEHAGQLRPDGPLHQGGSHSRIHPPGESAQHPAIPHRGPNGLDGVIHHVLGSPVRLQTRDVEQKMFQNLLPPLAVGNLRMPLDTSQPPAATLKGRDRGAGRARQDVEALGCA